MWQVGQGRDLNVLSPPFFSLDFSWVLVFGLLGRDRVVVIFELGFDSFSKVFPTGVAVNQNENRVGVSQLFYWAIYEGNVRSYAYLGHRMGASIYVGRISQFFACISLFLFVLFLLIQGGRFDRAWKWWTVSSFTCSVFQKNCFIYSWRVMLLLEGFTFSCNIMKSLL